MAAQYANGGGGGGGYNAFEQDNYRCAFGDMMPNVASVQVQAPKLDVAAVETYTYFYSHCQSAGEIVGRLQQGFSQMSAQHSVKKDSCTMTAQIVTPMGKVGMKVSIFKLEGSEEKKMDAEKASAAATGTSAATATTTKVPSCTHKIVFQRRKGPLLKFQELYRAMCIELSDIVCPPPLAME